MQRDWSSRRNEVQNSSPREQDETSAAPLPMFDYFCIVGIDDDLDDESVGGSRSASVLFSFPEMLPHDLEREIPSYCYPIGTAAYSVRRSNHLGEITDVVYGQHYDLRSDASFVFQLQTSSSDRPTPEMLFGVCFYRKEFLHRIPVLMRGEAYEESIPTKDLIASNRCYCFLSRVPMFDHHFDVLRRILSFERHFQIEEYAKQVDKGLWSLDSSKSNGVDQGSIDTLYSSGMVVRDVSSGSETDPSSRHDQLAETSGLVTEKTPPFGTRPASSNDFQTPDDNATPSAPLLEDTTPYFTAGTMGKSTTKRSMSRTEYYYRRSNSDDIETVRRNLTMMAVEKDLQYFSTSNTTKSQTETNDKDTLETSEVNESQSNSIELGSWIEAGNSIDKAESPGEVVESGPMGPTSFSLVWEHPLKLLKQYRGYDYRTYWKEVSAKEIQVSNEISLKNTKGESITRMRCNMTDIDFLASKELEGWAICSLCRTLSVENIILYLTSVLLERQIVVFHQNIGVLSGIVLALLPLLTPFSWQSLLLPLLPDTPEKIDLLDAPVPFVFGLLTKTSEIRIKANNLIRVNAYKDGIKNGWHLPKLPNAAKLASSLHGIHDRIRRLGIEYGADAHPLYEISPEEEELAASFASIVRHHLMSLTSEMAGYMITDVSGPSKSNDRCSILLKESFIDSFSNHKDREFMAEFVETQMFDMYTDTW